MIEGGVNPQQEGQALESILQRALTGLDHAQDDPATMRTLLDVARRHGGEEFGLEPVAVSMVHAVLGRLYGLTGLKVDWLTVAKAVAQALLEDDLAAARLRRLWTGLCERTR